MSKKLSLLAAYAALAATLLVAAPAAADWRADLDELLRAEPGPRQEELLAKVTRAQPDWREIAAALEGLTFPAVAVGTAELRQTICADGVARPWVLYIPPSYDPQRPTPLVVYLHGGVSQLEIEGDPLAYARENEWTEAAQEHGWLVLYPFGQEGATWWDEVGMVNIRNLLRTVKREYNVDDDRVYMAGFSDGASAAFCWAMVEPTDFAAFVALNGHLGVGSLDGDLATYAPNFFNTPTYVTTTFDDRLYPSARMRGTIEMARRAGGDLFYRELAGRHDSDDVRSERPAIARFLARHPRDPLPAKIVWETASAEFGRCRWFQIDEVAKGEAAPWHEDYNASLTDDRITVGFVREDFEGPGVKVGTVLEDTVAEEIGLEPDDLLIGADGREIGGMDDLNAWKETVSRGDEATFRVNRDGQELTLTGRFPPPEDYFIFKRERPSARADASFAANRLALRASRLGAFTVYVHPDMVNLAENLIISVNGDVVFDAEVKPDVAFMLENFLAHRDRKALYVTAVKVEL
jgi:poly(3-hydroxybutyrate) depolymerase